jgi:hypothetical protein
MGGARFQACNKSAKIERTALQAAEKCTFRDVLKGHGFSRAVQVLYFCYPEATLVAEGCAFPTFFSNLFSRAEKASIFDPRADFRPRGPSCAVPCFLQHALVS